jgi:hypothetical protein
MTLPVGQRFSLTYLERGLPEQDTQRFRRRLAENFNAIVDDHRSAGEFGAYLVSETGADVPKSAGYYRPRALFETGSIRDVLDAITCFYQYLNLQYTTQLQARPYPAPLARSSISEAAAMWHKSVARYMLEENMGYRLDEKCGVHYVVDAAFDQARASTIAGLSHPLLANARSNFEDACRHMDADPRDTKAAVRSIFEAAEVLSKQLCPGVQQLRTRMITDVMKPRVASLVASDATELKVWNGMLDGMSDWVDSMHSYRHGQPGPEPVAPSDDLAVFLMSIGSTYVRALAGWVLKAPDGAS